MSRNTHDRTRDHSGTEPASAVVLDAPAGGFPSGTTLQEVVAGGALTGRWEVMMTDGISSPPEPMTTEDGTDWLYAFIRE